MAGCVRWAKSSPLRLLPAGSSCPSPRMPIRRTLVERPAQPDQYASRPHVSHRTATCVRVVAALALNSYSQSRPRAEIAIGCVELTCIRPSLVFVALMGLSDARASLFVVSVLKRRDARHGVCLCVHGGHLSILMLSLPAAGSIKLLYCSSSEFFLIIANVSY